MPPWDGCEQGFFWGKDPPAEGCPAFAGCIRDFLQTPQTSPATPAIAGWVRIDIFSSC